MAGLGTNTEKSELARDLAVAGAGSNKPVKVPLCHMEYTFEKGWVEKPPMSSPSLPVVLSLHSPSYSSLRLSEPTTTSGNPPRPTVRQAIADSGAQMDIMSLSTLKEMGVDPGTLVKVRARVVGAVRGSKLNIIGGVLIEVRGQESRKESPRHRTVRLFYVASNVSQCYLSLSCHAM